MWFSSVAQSADQKCPAEVWIKSVAQKIQSEVLLRESRSEKVSLRSVGQVLIRCRSKVSLRSVNEKWGRQCCSEVLMGRVPQQCRSEVSIRSVAQKCRSEVSIQQCCSEVPFRSVDEQCGSEVLVRSVAQNCR